MNKTILYLVISYLIFFSGCLESNSNIAKPAKVKDPAESMANYLIKRNPPALESVEIWENDYNSGLVITTKHYKVYTTLLDSLMLSEIPGFVESAYRAYQNQLPLPIVAKTKSTIYLFKDRQQWESFTKSFAKPQADLYLKIKAGAYYLKGSCIAYNIGRERTFSVLAHECWHQFNNRHFKYRLPSWLDEGIAMQFETFREQRGLFYFEPAKNLYRLGPLRQTLISNNMISLNDLVSINPGQVIMVNDNAVNAFYSQAYALVRFLKENDYGNLLPNYHTLLMDGLGGNWPLDPDQKMIAINRNIPRTIPWNQQVGRMLFDRYISDDSPEIEEEYIKFCKKIVYYIRSK